MNKTYTRLFVFICFLIHCYSFSYEELFEAELNKARLTEPSVESLFESFENETTERLQVHVPINVIFIGRFESEEEQEINDNNSYDDADDAARTKHTKTHWLTSWFEQVAHNIKHLGKFPFIILF
jgi:hypothetical protein